MPHEIVFYYNNIKRVETCGQEIYLAINKNIDYYCEFSPLVQINNEVYICAVVVFAYKVSFNFAI